MPDVTIVIPAHNEADNIRRLGEELRSMMCELSMTDFEVILIDDGSLDETRHQMRQLAREDPRFRVLRHRLRAGQSAALLTGLGEAKGDVVVTLDADLQNPPHEVPRILAALDGFDFVSGVRVDRKDGWTTRVAGRVANQVRGWVLRDGVRDVGCSLKAFRREILVELPTFDGVHRFLPAVLVARGARVQQISVEHRPRAHGKSHYTIPNRLWRGIIDMWGVWWLIRRSVHNRTVQEEESG